MIGIIKVEQEKKGKQFRNDRIVAVHLDSRSYSSVEHLIDLEQGLVKEIVHFFASYNQVSEDVFKPLGNGDTKEAIKLIKENLHQIMNGNETR